MKKSRDGFMKVGKLLLLMVFVSLLVYGGCAQQQNQMKAKFENSMAIWNEGNLDMMDQLYVPGVVRHNVGVSEDIDGIEAYKAYVKTLRTTYSDFHVTLDEVFAAGDHLVSRWTVTGTNTGPMDGMPPTGKSINISGATIARAENGKIAEEWVYWNHGAVLTQLGYTITRPAAPNEATTQKN